MQRRHQPVPCPSTPAASVGTVTARRWRHSLPLPTPLSPPLPRRGHRWCWCRTICSTAFASWTRQRVGARIAQHPLSLLTWYLHHLRNARSVVKQCLVFVYLTVFCVCMCCIRGAGVSGMVTTYAGVCSSTYGYVNGPVASARFRTPTGLARSVLTPYVVYVCDTGNGLVRSINLNTGKESGCWLPFSFLHSVALMWVCSISKRRCR